MLNAILRMLTQNGEIFVHVLDIHVHVYMYITLITMYMYTHMLNN